MPRAGTTEMIKKSRFTTLEREHRKTVSELHKLQSRHDSLGVAYKSLAKQFDNAEKEWKEERARWEARLDQLLRVMGEKK